MNYQEVIEQIKAGKFPNLIGCHFSQSQIDEIERLLENRKNEITDYFNYNVKSRLEPTPA